VSALDLDPGTGHIVVRTPNWLGDTVMALPMLTALRGAAGAARITLIGRWAPLLAGQGVGDVLLPYPRPFAARRMRISSRSCWTIFKLWSPTRFIFHCRATDGPA